MSLAAIIFAGAPLDGDAPLALASWTVNETLIEWQTAQVRDAGVRDIVIVLGHEAQRVLPLVSGDNIDAIIDPRWDDDPASALRSGASAVARGTTAALLIELAEPRPASLCAAVLNAHESTDGAITRPAYHGIAGSPILVDENTLVIMRNHAGGGLRDFIRPRDVTHLEGNDGRVLLHIDREADIEGVRATL